jgi:hypothetical protein
MNPLAKHIPPPFTGEGDRERSEAVEGVSRATPTHPFHTRFARGASPVNGGGTGRSAR